MSRRPAAATAAVLLSGALFGAAAVLLGGFVVEGLGEMNFACEGSWPEGGTVWWWLLAGAALLAAGRAGFTLGTRGGPEGAVPVNGEKRPVKLGEAGEADRLDGRDKPGEAGREDGKKSQLTGLTGLTGLRGAERAALAVAVCLGLVAGAWGVGLWPGGDEDPAADRPATGRPAAKAPAGQPAVTWQVRPTAQGERWPGAWGLGDAVVHARLDGLTSYDARDGKVRWNVAAPTREAVCAMSPRVGRNIGLVAYGRHDKPCATLAAVHTGTGRILWRRAVDGDGVAEGGVAVGGQVAVAVEDRAVRGRSAESGAQRWQRPLGEDCEVKAVDADETRTLLVEQCGKGARVLALDTATGKERWQHPLDVESDAEAAVLSVAPAVVAVREEDERGTHAVLALDDRGTPTANVPLSGPDGVIDPFRRGRQIVAGGLLVTPVERSSSVAVQVVAYSLKDGRRVWAHTAEDTMFQALAPEPDGTVGALTYGGDIVLLDAATGAVRRTIDSKGNKQVVSIYPELIPVTGGHVVANDISMEGEPAVVGIR
ncbi:outer membrane protein assembly factor BamB family protein [Streptomyces sp. NPDC003943]